MLKPVAEECVQCKKYSACCEVIFCCFGMFLVPSSSFVVQDRNLNGRQTDKNKSPLRGQILHLKYLDPPELQFFTARGPNLQIKPH